MVFKIPLIEIFLLLLSVLFSSLEESITEDLGLRINAPVNVKMVSTWLNSLQMAYDSFVSLTTEIPRNEITATSTRTLDFQMATKSCFTMLKGKVINSADDFKTMARAVSRGLARAIVFGIRAVGELAQKEETEMVTKLTTTMDLMQIALEASYNMTSISDRK